MDEFERLMNEGDEAYKKRMTIIKRLSAMKTLLKSPLLRIGSK